jgi:hypothetical protein
VDFGCSRLGTGEDFDDMQSFYFSILITNRRESGQSWMRE